jgi:hypothetical protein
MMAPAAKPPITPAAIAPPSASAGAGAAKAASVTVLAATRVVVILNIGSPHAFVALVCNVFVHPTFEAQK